MIAFSKILRVVPLALAGSVEALQLKSVFTKVIGMFFIKY